MNDTNNIFAARPWLSSYPKGVPTDIDADAFTSIKDLFNQSCEKFAANKAFTCMGKSLTFGELADEASKLEVPKNPKLKDPKDFKIIGKYNKRLDVPDRVTGKAVYGIDIEVPNMVYACIQHSPAIHGKYLFIYIADLSVKYAT